MDLPPLPIVIVAELALCPHLEPLPHDEQEPLDRLDRRRELVLLEPRDPCLARTGAEGEAPLRQAVAAARFADQLSGSHQRDDSLSSITRFGRAQTFGASRAASPIRDRLIEDGLIYSPRRGQVAFTVPGFADYVRRLEPE